MQRSWDITTKPTRLLSELYRALTTLTAVEPCTHARPTLLGVPWYIFSGELGRTVSCA